MQVQLRGTAPPAPILLIEDEEGIQELLRVLLGDEGYRVVTARDGIEALEKVDHEEPGLLILNMQLPRSNGWDFAAAMRLRGKHIPTIVVTGRHDARLCAEAVEAESYFRKPFNCSALLEEVRRLCPTPHASERIETM